MPQFNQSTLPPFFSAQENAGLVLRRVVLLEFLP
jgi:hypothetical protein